MLVVDMVILTVTLSINRIVWNNWLIIIIGIILRWMPIYRMVMWLV